MIYLDYNASTPLDPRVLDAMLPYLRDAWGNPSAGHALARRMRRAVERAREQVADLIGSEPDEIVFTSGGTEGCNMVIKGVAHARQAHGRHLVTTAIEHPAVAQPLAFLERQGWEVTTVGVDEQGRVDAERVAEAVRTDTVLVAVMLANNETGTIQPVKQIAAAARARGAWVLTDAAQAVGKIGVTAAELGVDFVAMAGHKFYAPQGIGAVYIRHGIELEPLHHGAAHERGRRAGTEPVAQIVGLGAAAAWAGRERDEDRMRALRDRLHDRLVEAMGTGVTLNGHPQHRLPNTLNVSFAGTVGEDLLAACAGLCATTGAACHAGDAKASGVLVAMGATADRARGAVRLSVGRFTTEAEIDAAAILLLKALGRR